MSQPQPPSPLQESCATTRVIRSEIWERLHQENEHYMAGVFGREGKGKSGLSISIAQMVDPDFSSNQIMFDPHQMLEKISQWKADGTTKGRMIVADEAGVGLGNRTWYEKDQIKFGQILQLIRSENMGILFTVPRGVEMDSQIRGGRLHAQIIVRSKHEGEYVEAEYEHIQVSRRVDNDSLWSPKPTMEISGIDQRVASICIRPPTDDIWHDYLEKKNNFQQEQYDEAAQEGNDDDTDGEKSGMRALAEDIEENHLQKVVGTDGRSGDPKIDPYLIQMEFDASQDDARGIKAYLEKRHSTSELEDYV